jgi:hypothetical protein
MIHGGGWLILIFNKNNNRPVSVAQLVATRDNLCRGRGSNLGFPTSPHSIMCVNPATRLRDQKKKSYKSAA